MASERIHLGAPDHVNPALNDMFRRHNTADEMLAGLDAPDGIDDELEIVHERTYAVRAFRRGFDTLVLRGAVRDQKPAGLYIANDPEQLTVHHMIVDLTVAVPSLEILAVEVVLDTHPHSDCRRIEAHYDKLVGLSIARGFTHKVRELFGGPRGCTHTTALLQAMAPVAVQSMWSFRVAQARERGDSSGAFGSPEARQRGLMMNMNTCHIWAEDGEQVRSILNDEPMEVPVWIVKRFEKLGLDPAEWRNSD
jgi:hypothetical protein